MRKRYNLYALDDSHVGTFTADEIMAMLIEQDSSIVTIDGVCIVEEDN